MAGSVRLLDHDAIGASKVYVGIPMDGLGRSIAAGFSLPAVNGVSHKWKLGKPGEQWMNGCSSR
jgi:hypothetical protein